MTTEKRKNEIEMNTTMNNNLKLRNQLVEFRGRTHPGNKILVYLTSIMTKYIV